MGVYFYVEGQEWQPGENTLFYYPLTDNVNDYSGKGNNGTSTNVTFSSENGAYCVGGNSAGNNGTITTPTLTMGSSYTINLWVKAATALSGNPGIDLHRRWTYSNRFVLCYINASGFHCMFGNGGNQNGNEITYSTSIGTDWHNVCFVRNGATITIYMDGNLLTSGNGGYTTDPQYFYIGNDPSNDPNYSGSSYIKDYIMETSQRTAEEILDYYNLTKTNYGL